MKNKILKSTSKQLLIVLTLILLVLVVLALVIAVLNVANIVLQAVLILTVFVVVFCFTLLNHYIIAPLESLQKYLLGNTSELPHLMALDLNKELSDIVYEVNNIQANILLHSTVTNKQTQIIHLIKKQKNNVERLSEAQKKLKDSEKIIKKSNKILDENIDQINEVKTVFLGFVSIAERVNELSFKANLLAIGTQVETAKLGAKGEAFKEITKQWQQLAAYNVQTSKQCKLFLDEGKSTVLKSKGAITDVQKQLIRLHKQLLEGVTNSTTSIAEADSVLIMASKVQKEADRLEKMLFDSAPILQRLPNISSKILDIK